MVRSGFSGTLLLMTHQDQENQAQLEANLQTAEARTWLEGRRLHGNEGPRWINEICRGTGSCWIIFPTASFHVIPVHVVMKCHESHYRNGMKWEHVDLLISNGNLMSALMLSDIPWCENPS